LSKLNIIIIIIPCLELALWNILTVDLLIIWITGFRLRVEIQIEQ